MSSITGSMGVFLEDGFMYAVMAIGYYLTYTILDFPDLSVEGTVLTGGVSYALLVGAGLNPWLALLAAFICGALAGSITGILHVKLGIRPLLCGILVSTGLITVNLVVTVLGMGGEITGEGGMTTVTIARSAKTLLRTPPLDLIPERVGDLNLRRILAMLIVAIIIKFLIDIYLKTKSGLLLFATGNNEQFIKMLARDPGNSKIIGLALGNGLAAITGALMAQSRANANQGMGLGMVVIGIASVIIGMSLFGKVRCMKPTTKVILGAVIYQAALTATTLIGVPTAYNKLVMAALFTLALVFSRSLEHKNRGRKNAKA